ESRIRRDLLGVPGRIHHALGELGPAVLRPLRQVLGVLVGASIAVRFVIAELRRRLLPRRHTRPHRDRTLDRFEIQKAEPAVKYLESLLQAGLDDDAILLHRLDLPLLRHIQLLIRGQIRDPVHAGQHEVAPLLVPDVVEPHDVTRIFGPAALHDRAGVRIVSLKSYRSVLYRTFEYT